MSYNSSPVTRKESKMGNIIAHATTVSTKGEKEMPKQTKTWCVYHLIHVRAPHQHIPKLLITDAPDDVEVTKDLLERAGYLYEEFSIPWANHVLTVVDKDAPSDLIARLRRCEYERITYSELVEQAELPF